jgi:hypothetical protein
MVAVSHTVAVNVSHLITKRIPYRALGANYLDTDDSRTPHHTHGQTLRSSGIGSDLDPKGGGRLNEQILGDLDSKHSCSCKEWKGAVVCFFGGPESVFVIKDDLHALSSFSGTFRRK